MFKSTVSSSKCHPVFISFIVILMCFFFYVLQSRLALKPDGLFLAAILGGETLKWLCYFYFQKVGLFTSIWSLFCDICAIPRELRIACTVAQMEREGGISPRVSPLAQACVIVKLVSYLFIYLLQSFLYILNES